ncbi:MAG: trehalose-6-phosphate synthase [Deltaproteobacteria bacterium]|nr:trehalose-6-phosphate synthase [Deltaproteobacteria bacterium]MBW1718819.1 trehalose-6-phosphate synthase [Deltaproteobacteria bacterium]MBW1931670.1 trehalose-6-phosphate synthase [Deltaproteobacteria bacterium]MBW1937147.1 trehalose-6-phosphate synthase [Deltaproteobacteria bacterium]MBW1964173.1 trehalose-6-phosphate synthase [Deltaproteobacteria bacterium]
MEESGTRIVAVSNRLPIRLVHGSDGLEIKPGEGGLVTALAPVFRNRGGVWIGWSGGTDDEDLSGLMEPASREAGYRLYPVPLSADEVGDYYYGFANEVIWPLFHDLQTRCNFKPRYWHQYLNVNRKFAEITKKHSSETDYIWVHDYHLMHMAHSLKALGIERNTGFFLHIPFPPADIFMKLPWRAQILRALLEYELVGFQTMRDRKNFFQCLRYINPGIRISGRGSVVTVIAGDKRVRVGAFPVSIDHDAFVRDAESKEVSDMAWYLHEALPNRQIILGVDRLDYTKGIPERLEAFKDALSRFPELQGKITLVQVVVPSREEVPEYQMLRAEIYRLVGEINGKFTRSGWVPIHYLYRSLDRAELLAYYRLAEIAIITPLKDGMNLVAKEYCACNLEENGVLILSEFAGAAVQLHRGAIMLNPYDVEGMSNAIHQAFHMDQSERHERMHRLREVVRHRNIFWWVNNFLKAALAKDLRAFPAVEDYMLEIPLASN